jgi:hypothetical protein
MKLDSADRKILLIAAAVLVITVLISAVVSTSPGGSEAYPSSYSAESGGAKAAYTLLPQLGYEVEHWQKAPSKLLEHGINTVLVVAVPTQNLSTEVRDSVRRYIRAGGRLVAVGATAAQLLPHTEFSPEIPRFAWQAYPALMPSALTANAPEVVMAPNFFWRRTDSSSQVEYGDKDDGVVVSYKYGEGEVIWWATADPLTNSGITQASNLQLLLNSLGPASSRRVLWDDYFHTGEATLMDSLFASPLKWALLQLGLLGLVVIFTHSRRHGPVRPLKQPSRLAPLEFVETLGALYQRAGAAELPVQIAYDRFRFLLHRRLGISTSTPASQVAGRLQDRMGDFAPQFEQTLIECESARYQGDIQLEDSLRLVNSLELYSTHLKLTSRQKD